MKESMIENVINQAQDLSLSEQIGDLGICSMITYGKGKRTIEISHKQYRPMAAYWD